MTNQPQLVAPSPEVLGAMRDEFDALTLSASAGLRTLLRFGERTRNVGLNDGTIYPIEDSPDLAMSLASLLPNAPAAPPLVRGVARVAVILVEFPDNLFSTQKSHYEEMLSGRLREYYTQASYGKVLISGEVHGPYELPHSYSYYTDRESGTGPYPKNAQSMTEDAVELAAPDVDFSQFDPNSDGYVDALIIVHAGQGAEAIVSSDRVNHIWSHKWVMNRKATHDGINLYAYLTVPEDGGVGVWAHELGHLLFQWPDLYDTDYSSSGLGNWCLMAGGSWNGGGNTPALPCAWCKMSQGWTDTKVITHKETIALPRSSDHQRIWKLWTDGRPRTEYFLAENRQRHGFDAHIPGDGMLIYHVDETQPSNTQEPHYKVALVQADDLQDLENKADSGDAGDPYPGSTDNREFSGTAYSGALTGVSIKNIGESGTIMAAEVDIRR